jgi:sugar O-acyltransferase (sialic acid O-acetyltransferase NeuD family)
VKKNPEKIYILGAGSQAREVWLIVHAINQVSEKFEFAGFVDNNPALNSVAIADRVFPVYQEDKFLADTAAQKSSVSLAVGIGSPALVRDVCSRFSGYQFPNLIHPQSLVDLTFVKLGEGNIFAAGSRFTLAVSLGNFNFFNLNSTVSHDCTMQDFNHIGSGVNISGGVKIGSENLIGAGSVVLQYLSIGSKNILGAGAVLTTNLSSRQLAVGVPAKVKKEL